ncbi:MAG TPA: DOMON-like domain-containing protein [Steroidobacteraceae bacterium]|nr:DOMON-like domain-containing protein [Steroidobacteraceae bacterium]
MQTAHARLLRHPLAPWSGPAVTLSAVCTRADDGTGECRFELSGPLAALVVPAPAAAARVDGLWRHTCFELFAGQPGASGYREFNFSPSGEWAAYDFGGYRAPAPPPRLPAPAIRMTLATDALSLTAVLGAGSWPSPDAALELGLAAVLEAGDGTLGYFALGHPAARPDFHDRRAFALTLAPRARSA